MLNAKASLLYYPLLVLNYVGMYLDWTQITYFSDEHIFSRYNHVLECNSSGVRATLSHVLLLPARGNSGRVGVHDKARECLAGRALRVGVGSGQHKVKVGYAAVGDPHLLAVDDPVISLALSSSLDPGNIGTRSRL